MTVRRPNVREETKTSGFCSNKSSKTSLGRNTGTETYDCGCFLHLQLQGGVNPAPAWTCKAAKAQAIVSSLSFGTSCSFSSPERPRHSNHRRHADGTCALCLLQAYRKRNKDVPRGLGVYLIPKMVHLCYAHLGKFSKSLFRW